MRVHVLCQTTTITTKQQLKFNHQRLKNLRQRQRTLDMYCETWKPEAASAPPPMVCVDDAGIVDRFQQVGLAILSTR